MEKKNLFLCFCHRNSMSSEIHIFFFLFIRCFKKKVSLRFGSFSYIDNRDNHFVEPCFQYDKSMQGGKWLTVSIAQGVACLPSYSSLCLIQQRLEVRSFEQHRNVYLFSIYYLLYLFVKDVKLFYR